MSTESEAAVIADDPASFELANWSAQGLATASLDELRRIASNAGIASNFRQKGTLRWLKVATLRERLQRTRSALDEHNGELAGALATLPPFWRLVGGPKGSIPVVEGDEASDDADAAPAVIDVAARVETNDGVDDAAQLAALLRKLAGAQQTPIDPAAVEAIARTVAASELERRIADLPIRETRITVGAAPAVTLEGVVHEALADVVALLSIGLHVLAVGPRGSGKTMLAAHAAKALDRPFHFLSLSAGATEATLLGRLLPTGVYSASPFVRAYSDGGLILLDEVDAADPNVMLALNAALSNGHLHVPADPENPVRHRHERFLCVAAANTRGTGATRDYCGRGALDAAFLDRFAAARVKVDYSEAIERATVHTDVRAWGAALRKAIESSGLRRCISTRVLQQLTAQYARLGWGSARWETSVLADWSADERAKLGRLPSFKDRAPDTKDGGA